MGTLMQDLKYGFRLLLKSPGFAAAAVIVLALGIGANTAIFSVVNAVLLRPLPFNDAARLVRVYHTPPQKSFPGLKTFSVSPANYLDWNAQNHSFEKMAIYHWHTMNLSGSDHPEAVVTARVSSDFFTVLRAQPILGRVFVADDDKPGQNKVVILGYAFWQSHFGSNPNIVGQKITLDGQSYTVTGVMPGNFQYPNWAKIYTPLGWTDKDRAIRSMHSYSVIARLNPRADLGQANAELDTISARLAQQYPDDDAGWGAVALPLREDLVQDIRPALLLLLGAVAFVLLIACANVANLTLAKTLGRRKEMAIRAVLGASRTRVLRQVLSETTLLSLAGGALGIFLAQFGVKLIVAFLSKDLPRSTEIRLDGWVLAFTVAISLLTGIVAGIMPAWQLTKNNLNQALKQGLGRTDSDSGGAQTHRWLVISEVALSLILLVGAGLLIRSLWILQNVNPGLDPHNVLTMAVLLPESKYPEAAQQIHFFDQVMQRVRALPGVESAGAIDNLPTEGYDEWPIAIESRPAGSLAEQPEVSTTLVTPGYFSVMRIPLLRGRTLLESDSADAPPVVVISESLAKRFWPNENPIGRHLTSAFDTRGAVEVVGIVGDVKSLGLDSLEPVANMYLPRVQIPDSWNAMSLVVRTTTPPMSLSTAVANAIRQVDSDQPVQDVLTMDDVLAESISQQRFNMMLFAAFAALALLLAAVGIYSVLAYAVRRRVREIGIRMALGAQINDVLRLIVFEGMKPTLIGVAIGLAGALALGEVLRKLVFGVSASDPVTFAAVSILLAMVALFASVIPAYRATKVEPIRALRDE
jgi:putative ABC transport system permease protein